MLDLVIVEIIRSPDLRHTKETHWRHLSYLGQGYSLFYQANGQRFVKP